MELLKQNGAEDVLFLVGGTIPADDAEQLRAAGVAGVFGPGTPTAEIISFIEQRVPVSI
jgi:methylmalonyl-CoA mutase, C-terminal domain